MIGLPAPISGEPYTVQKRLTVRSAGAYDGWLLESAETSNQGGARKAGAITFNVGDSASNGQVRAILPDHALIRKVVRFPNLTGSTHFRLRLQLDDNNDLNADLLKFLGGNRTTYCVSEPHSIMLPWGSAV